jgi:hypothetical protein
MTTIETRLERVYRALLLIGAAAHGSDPDTGSTHIDTSAILRAIRETAIEVADDVHWVTELPATVLNMPAPTDDDVEDRFPEIGQAGDDRAANLYEGRQRLIDEAMARQKTERDMSKVARTRVGAR